ncbi:hypothetical protein ACNKHN_05165 [Shigella flexneri]
MFYWASSRVVCAQRLTVVNLSSDRASLYGGISSAITRSLRDYLLPGKQRGAESVPGQHWKWCC